MSFLPEKYNQDDPLNLYFVLNLSPEASDDEIEAAYYTEMALWEQSDSPEAKRRVRDIKHAYGVLSDPSQRYSYDMQNGSGVAVATEQDTGVDVTYGIRIRQQANVINNYYVVNPPREDA